MLKKLRENYIDLMRQTRYIGILVAVVFVLLAIREIWSMYVAILQANIKVYDPDLKYNITMSLLAYIIVGLVFSIRAIALLYAKKLPYLLLTVLFFLCVAAIFGDIYVDTPPGPYDHCTGEKICFGIYDMSTRTNILLPAGIMYVVGSFVRIAITSIIAVFRFRNNELNSYS